MTIKEFTKILSKCTIPFAHGVFSEKQKLPFGIYMEDEIDSIFANGKRVLDEIGLSVELYTSTYDTHTNIKFEAYLEQNKINYSFENKVFLDNEKCFVTYYKITFLRRKDETE